MQTQSEILGFDTRRFSNEPAAKEGNVFSAVRDVFGNVTSVLANLFDDGIKIYGAVDGRVKALKQIQSETIGETPVVVDKPKAPALGLDALSPKTLMFAALGAVALILVFKK